jgi:hypothetical protein
VQVSARRAPTSSDFKLALVKKKEEKKSDLKLATLNRCLALRRRPWLPPPGVLADRADCIGELTDEPAEFGLDVDRVRKQESLRMLAGEHDGEEAVEGLKLYVRHGAGPLFTSLPGHPHERRGAFDEELELTQRQGRRRRTPASSVSCSIPYSWQPRPRRELVRSCQKLARLLAPE